MTRLITVYRLVRVGRLELPLPKKTDFESAASTDSATPALTKGR